MTEDASLVPDLPTLLAVSSQLAPARSQMAFTLGFHIILASLGVAFPALMLIANYRGLRHNDPVALELAQRWSKVAAVLFAVGAVTGTVLSFEFGLLWPEFTGRFGEVFGVAFAIEGIFFFTEAIFIAIYIYGWKRLSGWAHFWTGVPVVISGLGGAFSVVAVNSWMNQPDGFKIASERAGHRRRPARRDLQPGDGVRGPAHDPRRLPGHRVPDRVGLRGGDAAGAAGPPPPPRAVDPAHRRRDRRRRSSSPSATPRPARSPTTSRSSSRRWSACSTPTRDVTEYLGGRCTSDGVKGGIGIPGFDSFLVGFSTDTKVTGLDSVPAERPPAGEHDAPLGLRRDGGHLHRC